MRKLIILIITLLLSFTSFAGNEGGCGGHGGDGYSLEFYRIGKKLAHEFSTWSKEDFSNLKIKFSVGQFSTVVENTRIVSTDQPLILNGKEVDAINHSDTAIPTIELNRGRWDSYANQSSRKLGIVLHEYLGIMQGLYAQGEWDHYQISSDLMEIYERKNTIEAQSSYKKKLERIKETFASAKAPTDDLMNKDFAWSCVEYSALAHDISKIARENSYLVREMRTGLTNMGSWKTNVVFTKGTMSFLREWKDEDPTEKIDQPKSTIKEFLRRAENGDMIAEITTDYTYYNQPPSLSDSKRGALSYLYCSRLGSETLKMLTFMSDSLMPIFEMPKTDDYQNYVKKFERLASSRLAKKCSEKNKVMACMRLYEKIGGIKLESETQRVQAAKKNMDQVNLWLNGLTDEQNAYASKPIVELFNSYAVHHEYMSSLITVESPRTPYSAASSLNEFVDSLKNRVPVSYAEAQNRFRKQVQEKKNEVLGGFGE